jgi:hypothetical protein
MTPVVVSLALYAVLGGAVAVPFVVVGTKRIREGRSTLGRVLVVWAILIVSVPILTTSLAYAYGRREAGFSDQGEVYPLWPFVLILTAFGALGGTFMWFLGWVLAWGVEPEAEV